MENSIDKVNPRDITIADAEQINQVNSEVTDMIRTAGKAIDELDSLSEKMDKLIGMNRIYKHKGKECRKKMDILSTEL